MAGLPWYKHEPEAFIEGVVGMSLEEIGAYTLLLNHMYHRGKAIRDSASIVCGLLDCDARVWKRVRKSLLDKGKLRLTDDGALTNGRVVEELEKQESVRRKKSKAGSASAAARAQAASKNDDVQGVDDPRYSRANAELSSSCALTDDKQTDSNGVADGVSTLPPNETGATRVQHAPQQNRTDRDRELDSESQSQILDQRAKTPPSSSDAPTTGVGLPFGDDGSAPAGDGAGDASADAKRGRSSAAGESQRAKPGEGTAAIEAYNAAAERAGWCKAVGAPSKQRQAAIRARLKAHGGLDGWNAQLAIAERSPHLGGANDRGWRMGLDWFINPQNWTKIAEGIYLAKPKGGAPRTFTAPAPGEQTDPVVAKWRLAINRLRDTGEWPRSIEEYQREPDACPSTLRAELIAVMTERGMLPSTTPGRGA